MFHNGVDVIRLRAVGEEKVPRRRFSREGREGPQEKRRSAGEDGCREEGCRKRDHGKNLTHGSNTISKDRRK